MSKTEIDKKTIEGLLPHREPMLLIDKLINIVPLNGAFEDFTQFGLLDSDDSLTVEQL